jgi:hypothetical protein
LILSLETIYAYHVFLTCFFPVHVSGSASDAKEDHQWPLKLSTWCKEEDISSSESFDSSDKSRGQSRKHKKEKDKPHSRSNHHHHHHHHHLHHIDQIGSEQKPCAENQDKTTSKINHCNESIDTMPQTKVAWKHFTTNLVGKKLAQSVV